MDCQFLARVKKLSRELSEEHQREFGGAGTLAELEELTCEIADELVRQVMAIELERRNAQMPLEAECPDCGCLCPRAEIDPVVLQGLRGEVAYNQPKHFCRHCRRSFFPDGSSIGSSSKKHRHTKNTSKSNLGRK